MKINLEDRLVEELDSIFDNERTSQVEWDACIEDIVEEYIARHNGTWEELYCDDDEVELADELDEIYIDLRNGTGTNGEHKHTITQPPFKNLRKPFRQ
tara:strand:- start:157 stop:450 length:294 start_codon:yes stop_codon:yes gene_type:complete